MGHYFLDIQYLDVLNDVGVGVGVHPDPALLGGGELASAVLLPGDLGCRHS